MILQRGKGAGTFRFLALLAILFIQPLWAKNHKVLFLNNDRVPDVINVFGGQLYKQLGDGLGGLTSPELIPLDFTPSMIDIGDLNNDQQDDLVAIDVNGDLSLSLGDGLGGFGDEVTVPFGFGVGEFVADVKVGLIDDDALLDVVVLVNNVLNSRVVILINDGNGGFESFVDVGLLTVLGTAVSVDAGDFNGDGFGDFMVKDLLGVLNSVLSDGLGSFQVPDVTLSGLPTGNIYFNDLNSDGDLDSFVLDELFGLLSVRLGNGDGSFASGFSIGVGALPSDFIMVDINYDGINDVVSVNTGSNSINVLLGDGLGGLVDAVGQVLDDLLGEIGGLGLPIAVVSADFNGDCRYDLAIWDDITDSYIVTLNQAGPDPAELIFCSVFEDQSAD